MSCAGCMNPIEGPFCRALDKEWHAECLVCRSCRVALTEDYAVMQGFPYCMDCNDRKHVPVCAKCQAPCRQGCTRAGRDSYHPACFVCSTCSGKLKGGAFFVGPRPYCSNCNVAAERARLDEIEASKAKPDCDPEELKKFGVQSEGRKKIDVYQDLMRRKMVAQAEKGENLILSTLPSGDLFEDPCFPANNLSLLSHKFMEAVWLRPFEYTDNPSVFCGGVDPGDVCQGELGDCWILSAISILAARPECLRHLFVSVKNAHRGIYTLRFFKAGFWQSVVIDDRIPCHPVTRKPLFASCADPNELWVSLIEKAYAKLHGEYGRLEGGNIHYGLRDLTAGAPEVVDIPAQPVDDLWKMLKSYEKEGFLLGCTLSGGENDMTEGDNGSGILFNHAYSILQFKELPGHPQLIQCRNPWGRCEWTGAYSDTDSDKWTAELAEALQQNFKDDGCFWIPMADFVKNFSNVFICRLFNDDWEHERRMGAWTELTAGGCLENDTWSKNEQFHVSVTTPLECFIVLTQNDSRMRLDGKNWKKYDSSIGFVVAKSKQFGQNKKGVYMGDEIATAAFKAARSTSATVTLRPRDSPFVIVPSTFEPGQTGDFILTVYAKIYGDEGIMCKVQGGSEMEDITEIDEIKEDPGEPIKVERAVDSESDKDEFVAINTEPATNDTSDEDNH